VGELDFDSESFEIVLEGGGNEVGLTVFVEGIEEEDRIEIGTKT
jgi:hypothetical protein